MYEKVDTIIGLAIMFFSSLMTKPDSGREQGAAIDWRIGPGDDWRSQSAKNTSP
jgi:hypothetical protein